MADKTLKISTKVDTRGIRELERAIKNLEKQGLNLGKSLGGINLGKERGRVDLAKQIVDSTKKMKDLKGVTDDTAKVMEYKLGRQFEKDTKRLDKYTSKIEKLNKEFDRHQKQLSRLETAGRHDAAGVVRSSMDKISDRVSTYEGIRQAIKSEMDSYSKPSGGGGMNWGRIQQGAQYAQILGAAGQQAMGMLQADKTMQDINLAAVKSFEGNLLRRMMSGDFSDLYFAAKRKTPTAAVALAGQKEQFAGQKTAGAGLAFGALAGGAQAVSGIASMATPVSAAAGALTGLQGTATTIGGLQSTAGNLQQLYRGGAAVQEVQSMRAGMEARQQQTPYEKATLDFIMSTAHARTAAARQIQGQHLRAWGIGTGYGRGMEESFALAHGLTQRFGLDATMGREVSRSVLENIPLGGSPDIRNVKVALDKTDGGLETLPMQRVQKTTRGRGLFQAVQDLERTGMDMNAAATMLGSIQQSTGGDLGKAEKALERAFSKAIKNMGKDSRLGQEIGTAMAEHAFGRGGAVTDIGAVGVALSSGLDRETLGRAATLRDVQANVAGLKAMDQTLASNPYFAAIGTEITKEVLGPNQSQLKLLASQRASISDLLGGSRQLEAVGIGAEERRKLLSGKITGLMAPYLSEANPETADLYKALSDSKGDFAAALKGTRGTERRRLITQYGTLASLAHDWTQEEGEAAGRIAGGIGTKEDKNILKYAKHADATAEQTVRSQQQILFDMLKKETEIRSTYLTALSTSRETAQEINRGDQEIGLQRLEEFLDKLIEMLTRAHSKVLSGPGAGAGPPNR